MTTSPRRSWFQFSLRGLLLAMFFVGVGIVIYRWPWEKEKLETPYQTGLSRSELGFADSDVEFEDGEWKTSFGWPLGYMPLIRPPYPEPPPELMRTTTYRRNWRGVPVKDGLEIVKRKDGVVLGQRWYHDGDLRRVTLLYPNGEVLRAESYRGGAADGPFEFREAVRSLNGNYRQGKKSGAWEYQYTARGERVTVKQSYANDLPHGEWRWQDPAGALLQSATFEQGQLADWNGRPWREELSAWLRLHDIDTVTSHLLNSQLRDLTIPQLQWPQGDDDFVVVFQPIHTDLPNVLLYSPQRRSGEGYSFFNYRELQRNEEAEPQTAWDALLPFALKNSRMPVYRFGLVGFVPISTREVHWRDTTGVSQVQFAPASPQQAAWEEGVAGTIPEGFDSDWWFQELFAGTPIQIDGSAFNPGPDFHRVFTFAKNPATNEYDLVFADLSVPRHLSSHLRSRRDVLGRLLYGKGFSCEQRGNVLIVKPWQ